MAIEADRHALTLQWRIENFSYLKCGLDKYAILSDNFKPHSMQGIQFFLTVTPKGDRPDDRHVNLGLSLYSDEFPVSLDCEFSFLGPDGSPLISGTVRNHTLMHYEKICLPVCPTQEEVFFARKSEFLPYDTLTVRCRIWKSVGELDLPEHIYACSQIKGRARSFMWQIPGFSSLPLNQIVTTCIDLDYHPPEHGPFHLNLSRKGFDGGLYFSMTTAQNRSPVMTTLKVSVLDKEGRVLQSRNYNHTFLRRDDRDYKDADFVERLLLFSMRDCLSDDVLRLFCEFTAVRSDIFRFIEKTYFGPSIITRDIIKSSSTFLTATPSQRNESLSDLGKDFLALYEGRGLSDFEIRSGDSSFPVHKVILSARSPVFQAMFSWGNKESDSNAMDEPDLDADTLSRMLTFFYAGTVESLQRGDVEKLYYAADKYQVSSLKQECYDRLRCDMRVSNVSNVLMLAHRHQDPNLISSVHDFILRNYDHVMASDEWGVFVEKSSHLAATTVCQISKKKLLDTVTTQSSPKRIKL